MRGISPAKGAAAPKRNRKYVAPVRKKKETKKEARHMGDSAAS